MKSEKHLASERRGHAEEQATLLILTWEMVKQEYIHMESHRYFMAYTFNHHLKSSVGNFNSKLEKITELKETTKKIAHTIEQRETDEKIWKRREMRTSLVHPKEAQEERLRRKTQCLRIIQNEGKRELSEWISTPNPKWNEYRASCLNTS